MSVEVVRNVWASIWMYSYTYYFTLFSNFFVVNIDGLERIGIYLFYSFIVVMNGSVQGEIAVSVQYLCFFVIR